MIVWIVLTDSPSRGGGVYSVKATKEEAIAAAKQLGSPADAIVVPWKVGSEAYDADYMEVTRNNGLIGYDSFAKIGDDDAHDQRPRGPQEVP